MDSNCAVFLDRDGTIIEDKGYLADPKEVELYPFAIDAMKQLQKNHLLFIITNQSGIAKGITSAKDVDRVNAYLLELLRENQIHIRELYCCPHQNEDNCGCKKPSPYFVLKAARDYQLNLSRSYVVGDHPSDVYCAINAGANPYYVLTGHGSHHLEELTPGIPVYRHLGEVALAIEEKEKQEFDERNIQSA